MNPRLSLRSCAARGVTTPEASVLLIYDSFAIHFFAHTAILEDETAKRRVSQEPTAGVDRRSPERPTKRRPVAVTTNPAKQ
jgi:hypothetical protein